MNPDASCIQIDAGNEARLFAENQVLVIRIERLHGRKADTREVREYTRQQIAAIDAAFGPSDIGVVVLHGHLTDLDRAQVRVDHGSAVGIDAKDRATGVRNEQRPVRWRGDGADPSD